MKPIHSRTTLSLALAFVGMLAFGPAMAEKPSWAGGGKSSDKDEHAGKGNHKKDRKDAKRGGHDRFEDRHRSMVRNYYDEDFRRGRCPPGLAKKHNGCMPPGQAKRWHVGHSLPRNVVYYQVPQPLLVQIGPPPSGYRYVRVDSDILLMQTATRMIIDAIQDLGRG